MTKRLETSTLENLWTDGQEVDTEDMNLEQSHHDQDIAAITNNFFGSGVLLESPQPKIIFDSDGILANLSEDTVSYITSGNFDGRGINVPVQPSDSTLGNQITIELQPSTILDGTRGLLGKCSVFGRLAVRIVIIGLDFNGNLQMDKFYFHRYDSQTTRAHYKQILTIMFNDFLGNQNCSTLLGGRVVVREALPFELSRDPKSVSQDTQPDLFFRDFKVASSILNGNYDTVAGLYTTIQDAIGPLYDADALGINITTAMPPLTLSAGDLTTRYAQKFLMTSDNIQKVTLLLGSNDNGTTPNLYDWSGNLIVSIHTLQTTVNSQSDIVPDLAIEFDPDPIPLIEVSFNQAQLFDAGYVLSNVAQPVDFVVTNTSLSESGALTVGNYYAIMVRRSGDVSLGSLFFDTGINGYDDGRLSTWGGDIWVDSPTIDFWFQVWSDSCKIASGAGYDAGYGIQYPKTTVDPTTGGNIDNIICNMSMVTTSSGGTNIGVIQSSVQESVVSQNERTGDRINSRQQYVPSFSFVTTSGLATLKETQEPLINGVVQDQNPKSKDTITGIQNYIGLVSGDTFTIINPSPDILSSNLIGRKLIPQQMCTNYQYTIMQATQCTDGYGDVNGDGVVDQFDLFRLNDIITDIDGYAITSAETQQKIIDGYFTTLELLRADVNSDGYVDTVDYDAIRDFIDKVTNSWPNGGSSFTHIDLKCQPSTGRWDYFYNCGDLILRDGYDGYAKNAVSPLSLTEYERLYHGNPYQPSYTTNKNTKIIVAGVTPINNYDTLNLAVTINNVLHVYSYIFKTNPMFGGPVTPPFNASIDIVTPYTPSSASQQAANIASVINDATIISPEYAVVATTRYDGSNWVVEVTSALADVQTQSMTWNRSTSNFVNYAASSVTGNPAIDQDGSTTFLTVPFAPTTYSIVYVPFWQDYLMSLSSNIKVLPQTFTYDTSVQNSNCATADNSNCIDITIDPVTEDPGRNDFFVPDNLVIGKGNIIRQDGTSVKPDFEIGTVILNLPSYRLVKVSGVVIDVFNNFVVDYTGTGLTKANLKAMKYYDCSTVKRDDLADNKLRFNVSIQSFTKNTDGYSATDGYGVIVDDQISVSMNQSTGLLVLTAQDLIDDMLYMNFVTKIQIEVYLCKGGWNNPVIELTSDQVYGLILGL